MILELLTEIISIFNEASLYLLFGFLVAAFLHIYLQPEFIAKHLGTGKVKPVLSAGRTQAAQQCRRCDLSRFDR